MNILFHIITKDKVAYVTENATLRQVMEKMEYHRYTAVPVISDEGKYIGVLREGDILWYLKNHQEIGFDISNAENLNSLAEAIKINELPRKKDHKSVSIDANMDELIELAINQNFIPIIDDLKNFIGIITRKSIIQELTKKGKNNKKQ